MYGGMKWFPITAIAPQNEVCMTLSLLVKKAIIWCYTGCVLCRRLRPGGKSTTEWSCSRSPPMMQRSGNARRRRKTLTLASLVTINFFYDFNICYNLRSFMYNKFFMNHICCFTVLYRNMFKCLYKESLPL